MWHAWCARALSPLSKRRDEPQGIVPSSVAISRQRDDAFRSLQGLPTVTGAFEGACAKVVRGIDKSRATSHSLSAPATCFFIGSDRLAPLAWGDRRLAKVPARSYCPSSGGPAASRRYLSVWYRVSSDGERGLERSGCDECRSRSVLRCCCMSE